ncbi:DUF3488 domain-containing protein [Virgisporangium aurantiacum]|uniref:Transglutaminase-like superfamily protein n=1 Tax=Virgisporangium aurantiacum TaxID=175570 RepID=A0A8J3ZJS0_9ACTN|nr:DUF3488 domain-containing protein [Virgisporangium aurantiacum]GIJ64237.1 hypothetical protein Vau01_117530 [Virgisporangium aurantiacum]
MTRVDVVLVVVATVAAGLSFDRAFDLPVLLPVVAAAAAVPALLLVLADRWKRVRFAVRAVVHLGSAAALFVLVRGGALALLAVTLPAPPRPELLVVPAAVTWLGAAVGTGIALLRWRRGGPVALLPAAFALTGAALVGPGTRLDAAFAAVVGLCGAMRLLSSSGRRIRAGMALAALVAVAVGVSPVVAPYARQTPVDVRAAVPRALLPRAAVNPLDLVDGWLTDPDRVLFSAVTDRPVRYWRLAVLDSFDGEQWQPPSRYLWAGRGVPSPPSGAGTIHQTVTVDGLDGPFLPAVDRPDRIGAPVHAVDPDSGVLLARSPVRTGLAYTVRSNDRRDPPDAPCVPATDVRADAATRQVPGDLAEPLRTLLGPVECGASFTGFADGVAARLRDGRRTMARSPATGTSIGAMLRFLDGDRTGTAVEFAAAFALAARVAHLPSRLVVGFEPAAVAAGEVQRILGRDVRVWVDVRLRDRGWTAYHPVPPAAEDLRRPDPVALPAQPPPPPVDSGPTPTGTPGPGPVAAPPDPWWFTLLAVPIGGYVLAVGLTPALRRARRRHTGTVRSRRVGAWHDVLDELAYRPAGHATPTDLLTATPASTRDLIRARCPDLTGPTVRLCRIAELSLFGPPGSDDGDSRDAWRAATAIRRRLRRRRRVRRFLSPSNLRGSPWQPSSRTTRRTPGPWRWGRRRRR